MDRKKFLSYFLLGSLLIVVYVLISNLHISLVSIASFAKSSLLTCFVGVMIAFILNIPTSFFERFLRKTNVPFLMKGSRALGIMLALVVFFLICFTILGFIIPSIIDAIRTLSQSILLLSDRLQGSVTESEPGLEAAFYTILNWLDMSLDELYARIVDFARENSPRFITSTFNTILGTISSFVTFFIATVFAIYFVSSKELLARHIRALGTMVKKPGLSAKVEHIASVSYKAFHHFVVAQVLEAIIIGALCYVGMLLFHLPNAIMTGVLVGVTALIPVYGAFVGAIFGAIVIAVYSPMQAVVFVVFIIILQQLEGNLIYPKVVGGSLGLPTVYTFMLVTIAGATFGLAGMLFAVPVGSICYTLIKEKKAANDSARADSWSAD